MLWSESPENFILAALAPYGPAAVSMPKVALDAVAHLARVEVDLGTMTHFAGEGGSRVRLASKLVGWEIQLVCREQN